MCMCLRVCVLSPQKQGKQPIYADCNIDDSAIFVQSIDVLADVAYFGEKKTNRSGVCVCARCRYMPHRSTFYAIHIYTQYPSTHTI